jgi:hypothetical protein
MESRDQSNVLDGGDDLFDIAHQNNILDMTWVLLMVNICHFHQECKELRHKNVVNLFEVFGILEYLLVFHWWMEKKLININRYF